MKARYNSCRCYVRNVVMELNRIKLPILSMAVRTNDAGILVSTRKEQQKPV